MVSTFERKLSIELFQMTSNKEEVGGGGGGEEVSVYFIFLEITVLVIST